MAPLLFLKALFAPAKILAGLSALFEFIVKNWKQLSIAAMIGLIFYQNFIEHRFVFGLNTLPHLEARIVELEQELETSRYNFKTCQEGNKRLEAAIKQQNEQIIILGELTQKFDDRFGQLANTLDKMRRDTNQTVQDILNAPTPETCEAAMDYLRQAAAEGFVW